MDAEGGQFATGQYEDTTQLARRTRTSESYWHKKRVNGNGPPFIKLGSRVLYRPGVVDAWLENLTRSSTRDFGPAEHGGNAP